MRGSAKVSSAASVSEHGVVSEAVGAPSMVLGRYMIAAPFLRRRADSREKTQTTQRRVAFVPSA
jgi:hypothetical protein